MHTTPLQWISHKRLISISLMSDQEIAGFPERNLVHDYTPTKIQFAREAAAKASLAWTAPDTFRPGLK